MKDIRVCASVSSLNGFKSSSEKMLNLTDRMGLGLQCLESLKLSIDDALTRIGLLVRELVSSIDSVETRINELTSKIDLLESEISEIEDTISKTKYEISNSDSAIEKAALSAVLAGKKARRTTLKGEVTVCNEKRAKFIHKKKQLETCLDKAKKKENDLTRSSDRAERIICEFERIRNATSRHSGQTVSLVTKAEKILGSYIALSFSIEKARPGEYEATLNGFEVFTDSSQLSDNSYKMDDEGKVYRQDDELLSNTTISKNGYVYVIDDLGRPISVSGILRLEEIERHMNDSLDVIGKGSQQEGDDRGHLIAHRFGGSDEMENLVPQDMKINRGVFKSFENRLEEEVRSGKTVELTVSPIYSDEGRRPESLFVVYVVDGKPSFEVFPNHSQEAVK